MSLALLSANWFLDLWFSIFFCAEFPNNLVYSPYHDQTHLRAFLFLLPIVPEFWIKMDNFSKKINRRLNQSEVCISFWSNLLWIMFIDKGFYIFHTSFFFLLIDLFFSSYQGLLHGHFLWVINYDISKLRRMTRNLKCKPSLVHLFHFSSEPSSLLDFKTIKIGPSEILGRILGQIPRLKILSGKKYPALKIFEIFPGWRDHFRRLNSSRFLFRFFLPVRFDFL